MRDNIKSEVYFDELIVTIYNTVHASEEKLNSNLIKPSRIKSTKKSLAKLYNSIIRAKYSRGDSMFCIDIKDDFKNAVVFLSESWSENHSGIIPSKKNKGEFLNQYSKSSFVTILDMLSLAVLIEVNEQDLYKIINYIDKDKVKDFLFEFMLLYLIENRDFIDKESYLGFFGINQTFGTLKLIIREESNEKSELLLKSFLEKEWLNSFKDDFVYAMHTNKLDIYSGYWCFIAAAIVKIKGLDDSSFRDNSYYPKDLVNF